MDIFEKLNKRFAGWYESLFGDAAGDLRPKDVLRKIIGAMEDGRKEGLDNRIYVPNKYILEIAFDNEDEKEYLLAFLDKEELESALRKYMAQNKYYLRGPLDFTVEEIPPAEGESGFHKLAVKCKWDIRPVEKETPAPTPAPEQAVPGTPYEPYDDEEYTVAATDMYDAGTVTPPALTITHADGSKDRFVLNKPSVLIGRSKRLDNDLVLDKDGMVSKRHAQITLGPEGFTVRDLDSTNGVWVNGERTTSRLLHSGDRITLGGSELVFDAAGTEFSGSPRVPAAVGNRPRLMLRHSNGSEEEFMLASEMVIGRALTSDVRLSEPTVDRRHARIYSADGKDYFIEDLDSRTGTMVNGVDALPESPVRLQSGDLIKVGEVEIRFERY